MLLLRKHMEFQVHIHQTLLHRQRAHQFAQRNGGLVTGNNRQGSPEFSSEGPEAHIYKTMTFSL